MSFDPNAAALPGSGPYGLPHSAEEARVILLPVPFDATTSYRKGAARGPGAIVEASHQVDLFDLETGRPYEAGIALFDDAQFQARVEALNTEASALAEPIIALGGDLQEAPELAATLATVNERCDELNELIHAATAKLIDAGKLVALVGGDHATPFGSIRAHAERYPGLGILHIDAHHDLRPAYEGFTWSHASIMRNAVEHLPGVAKLVQVGIRDFSEEEFDYVRASGGKVEAFYDAQLAAERQCGATFAAQCRRIAAALPREVYLSFDIDGLDPSLCPNTGTPVPGGLSFHEACALIAEVARSGRRIVGLDLNEVSPGESAAQEWDANVGARLLYKLIGWMLKSREG